MPTQSIRLGTRHGYRTDGDFVHLNAELSDIPDTSANWALRLVVGNGIVVATLPLPPGQSLIAGDALLVPPAGEGPWWPALELLRDGEIADRAAYPAPIVFVQPALQAEVNVGFDEKTAEIAVDRIINPRSSDNRSGTLALEIWALAAPCDGGPWQGEPVAGLMLGSLDGQQSWQDLRFSVPTGELPTNGHLTLMLREWTPAGYVTRDFRPLARPATAKPAPAAGKVAVNSATEAEIAAVKGISKTLAKAIVAARPYASLDELTRAKGVGVKLLARLRSNLTL
ncbi:MAG: helix-hairpin-helix domain-containing protein [Azonexaceae bacterium]|nr:helix-hairpin-helix domain-containing protein [Azonexaceae bacterium]